MIHLTLISREFLPQISRPVYQSNRSKKPNLKRCQCKGFTPSGKQKNTFQSGGQKDPRWDAYVPPFFGETSSGSQNELSHPQKPHTGEMAPLEATPQPETTGWHQGRQDRIGLWRRWHQRHHIPPPLARTPGTSAARTGARGGTPPPARLAPAPPGLRRRLEPHPRHGWHQCRQDRGERWNSTPGTAGTSATTRCICPQSPAVTPTQPTVDS